MLANRDYPSLIHHKRWARNEMIPDAKFARALASAVNHTLAYRHKTFISWGNLDNPYTGPVAESSQVVQRFRCHVGYGTAYMSFHLVVGLAAHPAAGDPRVELEVKLAGGAATTDTVYLGLWDTGTSDEPDSLSVIQRNVPVDEDNTYEVTITTYDSARIPCGMVYEKGYTVVNPDIGFIEENPAVGFPIYDDFRSSLLTTTTNLWKRNGSHLFSWAPNGASSPTFNTTTWTNLIDGSASAGTSTAGFYVTDSLGISAMAHCRISEPTTLRVVLAVHATMSAGTTGEIRLVSESDTVLGSITGIGAISGWNVSSLAITSIDQVDKIDVQCRTSNAANTMTVNAVSVYTYIL